MFAALRRDLLRDRLTLSETLNALFLLRVLSARRHAISDLLLDAVALRHRFGAHDVFYALLARRLDAPLVTCDGPLSRAAAGVCEVRYIA